jgi:hypothetical protein
MTEPALTPSAAALVEAATGHLHYPVLGAEAKAHGVTPSAVGACTPVIHEASGCTDPDPTYDDLDQMMTTCPKCEAIVEVVLMLGQILNRPHASAR